MYRVVIPRLCRHVRVVRCPTRGMNEYKKDVPTYYSGKKPQFCTHEKTVSKEAKDLETFQKFLDILQKFIFNITNRTPQAQRTSIGLSEVAEVKYNDRMFEVKVNVQQFTPEEINVKVSEDKLIITAKHQQKTDEHGFVAREFYREFLIPKDINVDSFSSILNEDGMMIIRAHVEGVAVGTSRVINIEKTKDTN